MIVRFLRSALLGTTMLVSFAVTPAHADPISVAILGAMGYSGAAGLLAPTAVLGSLLWNGIVAALPSFLLNAAIGIGLTLLSNALRPQPQPQNPGARIVNLRQSVQDRTRAYGLVRLGGAVAFWKGRHGRRYVTVLINTGEINAFVGHYLDEIEVTTNSDGYVLEDRFRSDGDGMVRIAPFLGAPGQTAPPILLEAFGEFTEEDRYTGLAGAVVVFRNPKPDDFAKVYSNGREQTYSALIEASKVYDPRDPAQVRTDPATWKYNTNAALVIANWLTHPDGLGAEVTDDWWEDVAFEADAADVQVLDRNGNSIPTWQLCGSYSFGQAREQVRQQLAIACDAFFYDRDDGTPGFVLGRWIEPDVTITDRHVMSIRLGEGQDGTDRPNAVTVQYNEPGAGYREYSTAPFIIEDGEPYNEDSFQALWAPNHNQAVRVGARVLKAKRSQFDVSMTLNLYGLRLRDKRFFRLELTELGISSAFELASWSFGENGTTINVSARSTSAADLAFNPADEPAPGDITGLDTDETVSDPTGVVLSSPAVGTLHVAFDAPPRPSLLKRVRYREVGTPDWNEAGVPSAQLYLTVNGLPPGTDYEAQVQFRTATAKASNWVESMPASIEIAAP